MRRRSQFLVIAIIWMMLPTNIPPQAAYQCTNGGARVRDNFFSGTYGGWYCSLHPGDSESICNNSQASLCSEACNGCLTTLVSTNGCTWNRTQGPGSTDPVAQNLGCSGTPGLVEWGQFYDISCNCAVPSSCDPQPCEAAGGICYDDVCTFASPIVIPVGKNQSYHLTSVDDGVSFDILATGTPRQVAWTQRDEPLAFLAMDRDNDGKITSARELFGNHTVDDASNGFEALRLLNHANPAYIDWTDADFAKLLLWTDINHNGLSEASELQAARNVLSRIGLDYTLSRRRDEFGNQLRYRGWANKIKNGQDDHLVHIFDVIFRTR